MLSPATGPLRLVRAAVLVVVCLALGAAAHSLGGGALPPAHALGAIAALAFAPAVLLTGRRLRAGTALAALGVGQVAMHALFAVLGRVACVVPGVAPGPHAGHGAAAASAQLAALSTGPGAAAAGCVRAAVHIPLAGHAMLAAHVAATVATALVLAGGERALWWLAAWLRPLVRRPAVPRAVAAPRLLVAVGRRLVASSADRTASPTRGPPRTAPAPA